MPEEEQLLSRIEAAKTNREQADRFIRDYLPFIRAQAAKTMGRPCTDGDDELSVAMLAFSEAIRGYDAGRGSFLGWAALCIRSRLIDYARREARHGGTLSTETPVDDGDTTLGDTLREPADPIGERELQEATRQEILELAGVLQSFGVSFADVADNCPRQERTLQACRRVLQAALADRSLLDELLRTRKLPLARLVKASGAERKTLERHRKYILAMLVIQTNGYEIIRGHIRRVLAGKGGGEK